MGDPGAGWPPWADFRPGARQGGPCSRLALGWAGSRASPGGGRVLVGGQGTGPLRSDRGPGEAPKIPDIRRRDHPLGRSDRDGIWENRRFLGDLWALGKIRSDGGCRKPRPTPGFLGLSLDHRAEDPDLIGIRSRKIREFPRSLGDPGSRRADQAPEDLRNPPGIAMVRWAGGKSDR